MGQLGKMRKLEGIYMLEITRGKITKALRVVVYGPEGIGKSTFAAQFPRAVFIDTEGSTNQMDVARFEPPKDWSVFLMELHAVRQHPGVAGTLVIDTADWAMRLCEDFVCRKNGKDGIEDFGYGRGYTYAKEEWGRALDILSGIVEAGTNVVLTAHSAIRKFERPDEMGAYDRWELKMGGKAGAAAAALCKEWADILLFANYKEIVVEVNGKNKAQGGKRVMYTCHTPAWDAKNRMGMPPELPFEYAQIAHIVPNTMKGKARPQGGDAPGAEPPRAQEGPPPDFNLSPVSSKKAAEIEALNAMQDAAKDAPQAKAAAPGSGQPRDGVDPRILQLCDTSRVSLDEVSRALQEMGIAPGFFPVREFPQAIAEGVVTHWQDILKHVNENSVPF